jgi:hypothetical protein
MVHSQVVHHRVLRGGLGLLMNQYCGGCRDKHELVARAVFARMSVAEGEPVEVYEVGWLAAGEG